MSSQVTELFSGNSQPPHDALLQQLIIATAGSYDVIGELGRGGMAVVYQGIDRKLERRVAIKVMDPRLSMTPGMAQRFLQEARIAARLQHPNIIVVHDVRSSDEIIFFVMGLIDGVAVDEVCRQQTPLPIDQIRWVLMQAARALAHAHGEGIVHRDIKPANILLNLKGDVILTDFGIAKALGETGLTQSGTQVGTPVYMSPEQFSGMPVGPASDQYALGVTAYQMIVGRPPFSGDLYQLIAQHGTRAPDPILEQRPDCRPFIANAVMRMLEKRPEDRWPSLDDLVTVFGASMAMDGGVARRNLADTVRSLHARTSQKGAAGEAGVSTPAATPRPSNTTEVSISPPGASMFVSQVLELRASVLNDMRQSLPGAAVTWTSSNETILTVQPNGTVIGVAPGDAVVRASVNGVWSEATIRVEAPPIARLSVTVPQVTMRVGDVLRPDVTAIDVNGTSRDDVPMAWISRAPDVADVETAGVVRAIAPGTAVIDVSTGQVKRSIEVAVLRRPVAALRLTAPLRVLKAGESVRLGVDAFDDLGAPTDASSARWTSSAPSIIHIDSTGRALSMAPGVARVTAVIDDATDSVELESLEPAVGSLQLMVANKQLRLGDDSPIVLRVKDITGTARSKVGVRIWSSNANVVRVDELEMRLHAVGIGEALVHAAPDGADAASATATSERVTVMAIAVPRTETPASTIEVESSSVSVATREGADRRAEAASMPRANTAAPTGVPSRWIAVTGSAVVLLGIGWLVWPKAKATDVSPSFARVQPNSTSSTAQPAPAESGGKPSAATAAAALAELPNANDLRLVANQVVRGVMSGTLRNTPDVRQFFVDGTEHQATVGSAPAMTEPDQGRIRTQFDMVLTRINADGGRERRVSVVHIEVARRIGGAPEMLSVSFGALVSKAMR